VTLEGVTRPLYPPLTDGKREKRRKEPGGD